MESTGTKQQTVAEGNMATTEVAYLGKELERRRERLLLAAEASGGDASIQALLNSVDAALGRMQAGTFGVCEECHGTIETDRLLCDPLVQFCLDHLSTEDQRALERDLGLAAQMQRALLPR